MTDRQLEQMRINSTRNPMTITSAYKAGALDMQEKMIEKACEAFCRYCPIANNYTCPICERKNDFRKAMEE